MGSKLSLIVIITSLVLTSCSGESDSSVRQLTVLYTNDEHGWMEGSEEGLSAASLYELWVQEEGYSPEGAFLLLSGGDNWTGPAISTWFEGESMVEVMNTMGYDGSAVGNHEFDFGLEALRQRASEAAYPYLSANISWKNTGAGLEDLNIYPHAIKEVNDLKVGIIGLTTLSTPTSTMPSHVRDLVFTSYEQALRNSYAELAQDAPDLVFVISHVCIRELKELAETVADLSIDFMGAGHCNELVAEPWASTYLLGGGSRFASYAKANFSVAMNTKEVIESHFATESNKRGKESPLVDAVVDKWRGVSDQALSEELAYSSDSINQTDEDFQQAIIDSWLIHDPTADIAITNAGGIREGLPAGIISFGDVFAVLPFDNSIVAAQLSGRTVATLLEEGGRPVFSGLTKVEGEWRLKATDEPLQNGQRYRVLLNSFMYDGGDNFGAAATEDPAAFDTGIPYRRPFVDWLKSLSTTQANPLSL